jgi:hypothetical protein
MAKHSSLTVRNLSPATKTKLSRRAKAKGRSLEAEVRAILDAAAQQGTDKQPDFPDWFVTMLVPGDDDVAAFLDSRRTPHQPVKL